MSSNTMYDGLCFRVGARSLLPRAEGRQVGDIVGGGRVFCG